jgi:hypothetical protein
MARKVFLNKDLEAKYSSIRTYEFRYDAVDLRFR